MLNKVKSWWKWRNTPQGDLSEIHDLTVMAARRCAYDLKHAGIHIAVWCKDEPHINYEERAYHWLDIFNPADGPKKYRHRLHQRIEELHNQVENYRKFLEEQGITDPFPDLPF